MSRARTTRSARHAAHHRVSPNGLILVTLLLLGAGIVTVGLLPAPATAQAAENGAQPSRMPHNAPNLSGSKPAIPTGRSAIHPHLAIASNGATYTLADAERYVSTHSIPNTQTSAMSYTVTRAAFMTDQAAGALLKGETIGLPAQAPVCVVLFQGSITFLDVPSGATPLTFKKGFEVFDARTGNLLVFGGLD